TRPAKRREAQPGTLGLLPGTAGVQAGTLGLHPGISGLRAGRRVRLCRRPPAPLIEVYAWASHPEASSTPGRPGPPSPPPRCAPSRLGRPARRLDFLHVRLGQYPVGGLDVVLKL